MPEEQQLQKLFQSTDELEHVEEAHVNGEIPNWLNGSAYIRVGPGKFDLDPNFTMNHWLDGYSILSRFEINEHRIQFNKKFLQSEAYKRAQIAKKPVFCEYATKAYPDPQKSFFSKLTSRFFPIELTDNDTLSLFKLANELFASSETSFFRQVDPCSLRSGDRYDTNKYFGLNVASAHPLTDPETGITYQLGSTLTTGCKYHFVKIPPPSPSQTAKDVLKKSKTICTIDSTYFGALSFNHSFGMTSKYLIFIEQPYVMNITRAISSCIKGNQTFKDWLEWRPDSRNRFFIVEKETGRILKTEFMAHQPFFFLHFINCYEENNQIVVDVNAYPSIQILESMFLSKLRSGNVDVEDQPCAVRYVLPLIENIDDVEEDINLVDVKTEATAIRHGSTVILTCEELAEKGFELPMINWKVMGKRYSYIYATGSVAPGFYQSAIGKIDVRKKETILWKESDAYYPGEPMFVPNPQGAGAEDDGVLISCVTDTTTHANDFILFLDAKNMKELGRAQFKAHIPQALHGIFLEKNATSHRNCQHY